MNKLIGKEWGSLKEIVLFGYGRQGKRALEAFKKDFQIVAVIDNAILHFQYIEQENIPLIPYVLAEDYLKQYKIIVTVTGSNYLEIVEQLRRDGLKEYRDFVRWGYFVMEWYYSTKRMVYMPRLDVICTTKCSLNCEKCAMFIPYFNKDLRKDIDIEILKEDIDCIFRTVDFIFCLTLVGGETLLYQNLNMLIDYIGKKYRDKIASLDIITNGTIIPDELALESMKKWNVLVMISDYQRLGKKYEEKLKTICDIFETKGIHYSINHIAYWKDEGFPSSPTNYSEKEIKNHFDLCGQNCPTYEGRKIYFCGIQWAAQKGGLYPEDENAYYSIQGNNIVEELLEFIAGEHKSLDNGLNFCKVCAGHGNDNQNFVEVAK